MTTDTVTGDSIEDFFAANSKPANYDEESKRMKDFCKYHRNLRTKVVLITSGGTTVPLEQNTVRFVDNFSAGTRGACSAEYFLSKGYAVIFLYRSNSLEPFTRHFPGHSLLDALEVNENEKKSTISVRDDMVAKLLPVLSAYRSAVESGLLLMCTFVTLGDYAWLIKAACEAVRPLGSHALLYLAAAVADFYVPANLIPKHKIQSSGGTPKIQLHVAPKILQQVATKWAPETYIVSFKLETDEDLLVPKAKAALEKYKHKVVVGNILNTRKFRVLLFTQELVQELVLSTEEQASGFEIENKLVDYLSKMHTNHIENAFS